jgi:hypothetical protein
MPSGPISRVTCFAHERKLREGEPKLAGDSSSTTSIEARHREFTLWTISKGRERERGKEEDIWQII